MAGLFAHLCQNSHIHFRHIYTRCVVNHPTKPLLLPPHQPPPPTAILALIALSTACHMCKDVAALLSSQQSPPHSSHSHCSLNCCQPMLQHNPGGSPPPQPLPPLHSHCCCCGNLLCTLHPLYPLSFLCLPPVQPLPAATTAALLTTATCHCHRYAVLPPLDR
jgi:hypothetical protein